MCLCVHVCLLKKSVVVYVSGACVFVEKSVVVYMCFWGIGWCRGRVCVYHLYALFINRVVELEVLHLFSLLMRSVFNLETSMFKEECSLLYNTLQDPNQRMRGS